MSEETKYLKELMEKALDSPSLQEEVVRLKELGINVSVVVDVIRRKVPSRVPLAVKPPQFTEDDKAFLKSLHVQL